MSGKNWVRNNLFGAGSRSEHVSSGDGLKQCPTEGLGAAVQAWMEGLRLGDPWQAGDLTFHPLIGGHALPGPFVPSVDAIADGLLEVREVGSGVVGELLATNLGRMPVLIPEGETLVGCKQNRVVAHSVLVGPDATARIPVGCMEQGRWTAGRGMFSSGSSRMEPGLRKFSVASKIAARSSGKSPRLDQGRLWQGVSRSMRKARIASPTSDYHAVLQSREAELRRKLRSVAILESEVGVLVERTGDLVGVELLGDPAAWAKLAKRTLGAFLLAAGNASRDGRAAAAARSASGLLRAVATARIEPHPALGFGRDFDLHAPGLIGSGLWFEGAPAHLAMFGA